MATTVGRRLLAGDQPRGHEVRQDAAQIPGIQAEFAAQVRDRNLIPVGYLEQNPGFGEPERRAGKPGPQQSQHPRIEAIEFANLVGRSHHSWHRQVIC